MLNRIESYAEVLRARIVSGLKPDGTPLGDMVALEDSLDVTFDEHAAYQNAQAAAHAGGTLTTEEASTIYQALGAGYGRANGGWRIGTDLALKVTVTALMGQLLGAGL